MDKKFGYYTDKYVEGSRTFDGNVNYYYAGDRIQLYIPVPDGCKLSAGSYVIVDGIKVHPTASTTTNGYVTINLKNALDVILKRPGASANPIRFEDKDITVDFSYIDFSNDRDFNVDGDLGKNLNFSPLGVKSKSSYTVPQGDDEIEYTPVRFGTVWYFDDYATKTCWSRGDGMGTLIMRPNKMFSKENNDFYNFVLAISKNECCYKDIQESYTVEAENIIKLFHDGTDAIDITNFEEEIQLNMFYLLNAFSTYWERKANDDNSYTRLPSFGTNVAANTPAEYYYYMPNENGDMVMEYSAVLHVPSNKYDEPLLVIPYVSYVKGSTGVFIPESQAPYNVYLLSAPYKFYTAREIKNTVE
jgi:hypothetical protein